MSILRHSVALLWVSAVFAMTLGCDKHVFERGIGSDAAELGGGVAARVGDQSITLDALRSHMEEKRLPARAALDEMIAEALLAREATDRGYATQAMQERFSVQYLLGQIEQEHSPVSIPEADVRKRFEEQKKQSAERRKSIHVLVKGQDAGAEKLATQILAEFKAATDPMTVFEHYRGVTTLDGYKLKAEDLPPVPQEANWDKAFLAALFEAKALGPLAAPVKSSFGWHAIVLTEIVPAMSSDLANHEAEIRNQLAVQARATATQKLLADLKTRVVVSKNESVISDVSQMDLGAE